MAKREPGKFHMTAAEESPLPITELRLGKVTYDNGRSTIRFGTTIFRYAALVATVRCSDGSIGTGVVWTQIDDEVPYLQAMQPPLAAAIVGLDALTPFVSSAACRAEAQRIDAGRVSAAIEMALWDLAGRVLEGTVLPTVRVQADIIAELCDLGRGLLRQVGLAICGAGAALRR